MALERARKTIQWFRQAVSQPRDELDRWEAATRFAYDLCRYGARQLRQDRAPQMAAALAYRTLFSLLPVLVVGTLLVRALGGFESFKARLAEYFQYQGWNEYEVTGVPAGEGTFGAGESLSEWLLGLLETVQDINLAAITWVGLALVIYATLGLMVTIENSFNNIYRASEGRSWARRMPIYWTVLTLGPAALAGAVYAGNQFDAMIGDGGWWTLIRATSVAWNFLALWIVMFVIYKLLPNTEVAYRPALIGAFVASLLVEIGRRTLGLYFEHAVSFSQLYGSLGLIPVFMFWVYVMWLLVLFGLEVSAALQMLGGRRLDEVEQNRRNVIGMVDPASVIVVVQVIADRFDKGNTCGLAHLAEHTGLAERTLRPILDRLTEEGIVHRVEASNLTVTLARPPEQIEAERLISLGFDLATFSQSTPGKAIVERMRTAQREAVSSMSLATLIGSSAPAAATDQAAGT